MKKRFVVLSALLVLTAFQGVVVSNVLADDSGTFTTMWVIDLPRTTYFIGETVTFTATAFASTDPTLMLPDQMAKITIRNSSMVEVYATWITTNSNGSAPVSWVSNLNSTAENYTIILDDLKTTKITATFNLLFNEETYWQTRVDLLEQKIQYQYSLMNYLFAVQKFQGKKIAEQQRQITIYGVLAFVTVMCALYVGMHEMSRSKRSSSGLMAYPSKAVELVFRSKPIVELDSEILEDVHTPKEKRVPIYGHDQFCPICDPAKLRKLTENQLRDHLWAKHDRLHLKKDSFMAKWRTRKAEKAIEAKKKENEAPKLTLVSEEKAKEEWNEMMTKKTAQARLKSIKHKSRNGELTPEQTKAELSKLKDDLQKSQQVLKQTEKPTSANGQKMRKLLGETPLFSEPSGIHQKPIVTPPVSTPPKKIPDTPSKLDVLLEEMRSQEKVN